MLLRIFSHSSIKVLLKFFGSVAVHFSKHERGGKYTATVLAHHQNHISPSLLISMVRKESKCLMKPGRYNIMSKRHKIYYPNNPTIGLNTGEGEGLIMKCCLHYSVDQLSRTQNFKTALNLQSKATNS